MHVVPSHQFQCESVCLSVYYTQCMHETEFYDDNDDDGSFDACMKVKLLYSDYHEYLA